MMELTQGSPSRVLVLAPHTDDGELGCGATMAYLAEQDVSIHYIAFSICETSVPEGFAPDALMDELYQATEVLGLARENIDVLRYPVRRFNEFRQEILEYLVKKRAALKPDLVFMPSSRCIHQDHQVIYNEGLRAFKRHTCLGYDLPWDTHNFTTNAFQVVAKRHVMAKCEALSMYKTQAHRGYVSGDFVRSLARVRGEQIHEEWAEAFEVLRLIFSKGE